MTYAEKLRISLLSARNADGGWPFRQGHSWTEPTALALLALQASNDSGEVRSRAAAWIAQQQSPDGGWPPCATVPTSTWVSSLALLSLAHESAYCNGCLKGVEWLTCQICPDITTLQGFIQHRLGMSPARAPGGFPWFPGTAGWVIPTSFSILALSCWAKRLPKSGLPEIAARARKYLLSHRCADGGWNHGGSPQRSEASPSYAETTGLALLALAQCQSPALEAPLFLAQEFLRKPDSPEGAAWLLMGLAAHGRKPAETRPAMSLKTTRDIALQLIACETLRSGHNVLLASAA